MHVKHKADFPGDFAEGSSTKHGYYKATNTSKSTQKQQKNNLPQLTVIEKQAIVKLLVEGKTGREKIERMGLCSRSTACRIYDRFLKTRKIFRKKGLGDQRKQIRR